MSNKKKIGIEKDGAVPVDLVNFFVILYSLV